MTHSDDGFRLSRRTLFGTGLGGAALVAADAGGMIAPPAAAAALPEDGAVAMTLSVNGDTRRFTAGIRTTLLDALREKLELTGSKKGCDHGQCGACTVHVDGRRVLGCLTLAASVQGKEITTVEGLAKNGKLHPMQQAFLDHDAYQCGYCTPGQIMSAIAVVAKEHADSDDAIREHMSGNLCRCAAYPNIVAAIKDARAKMPAASAAERS